MKKRTAVYLLVFGLIVFLGAGSAQQIRAREDKAAHAVIRECLSFGGAGEDYFTAAALAQDGIVAVGYSDRNSFGTGDWADAQGKGLEDAFIIKYRNDGTVEWKKHFGGEGYDYFQAVAAAEDGYVAAGYSYKNSFETGDWTGVTGSSQTDAILVKYDNGGNIVWKKNFHGKYGNSRDEYRAVAVAKDGYIAVGTAGGSGPLNDALVVKYDRDGNVVWQKTFGGDGSDDYRGVAAAEDGFIAVGESQSSSFGNGDWSDTVAKGLDDAIAVKYDYNGNILWKQNFGGAGYDMYYAVTAAKDGFVAAGSSYKSSFGNGDWSGIEGENSAILVKYSPDGTVQWKEKTAGNHFCSVVNADAGFIAAGSAYANNLNKDEWTGTEVYGRDDMIAVKYDSNGNAEWRECFGGSGTDACKAVLTTEDGYAVVGNAGADSFETGSFTGIKAKGKNDAVFIGWFEKDGPVAYYPVTFDLRGGTGNIPAQTIKEFEKASSPDTEPVRAGYIFKGWYLGETRWNFEMDEVTEAITLRAKWEPEEAVRKAGSNYIDGEGYYLVPLIEEKQFELGVGATTYNTIESASWSSTNENVLRITGRTNSNCMVQAVAVGKCEIRAVVQSSYTYYDAILKRNVTHYGTDNIVHKRRVVAPVTDITLQEEAVLDVGEEVLLSCETVPAGNYSRAISGFGFRSSDETVVVVDEEGFVRAVGYGAAEITAYAADYSNASAVCRITVQKSQGGEVQEPEEPSKVYTYQAQKDGTVWITGYQGTGTSLEIPEAANGKRVTGIGENAFLNAAAIQKIYLPDSIATISSGAFAYCSGLTEIRLPNGLTAIPETAFYGCSSLKDIVIPREVTDIGNYAFFGCVSLPGIYIPEKVAHIGEAAFGECTGLLDVYFEGSQEQWNRIVIEENNAGLTGALIHFHTVQPDNGGTGTCSHTWMTTVTRAALNENGSIKVTCSKCKAVQSETVICAPSAISLSKARYTYNGKVRKPSVTVKDSKQKTLADGADYSVLYPKGMKEAGIYTITIQFRGNYSGTAKLEFSIVPQTTRIQKLIAKTKGFLIKWKKQTKQTSGYEISYSTSRKFKKGNGKITVGKNKTISAKAKGLKAGKQYFVRIRTYKKVKTGGQTIKIYSDWSGVKKVTVKK